MGYCPNCGNLNQEGSSYCTKCGTRLNQQQDPNQQNQGNQNYNYNMGTNPNYYGYNYDPYNQQVINNHLVKAILTTLFCCLPLGIVAIVYAAQVDSKRARGDIQGAMESSKNANLWGNIALGLGLAVYVIYFIFIIIFASTGTVEYTT